MNTVSASKTFCRRCTRQCGNEIEECIRTNSCVYRRSPHESGSLLPNPPIKDYPWISIGVVALIAIGGIALLTSTTQSALVDIILIVSVTIALIVLAVMIFFNPSTTQTFHDSYSNTQLNITTWAKGNKAHAYCWYAAPKPLSLAIPPLQHPAPMSAIAAAIVKNRLGKNKEASLAQAVGVGRAVVLELLASGFLEVYARQIYTARGTQPLQYTSTSYEIGRTAKPLGAQLGQLETNMLKAFQTLAPGTCQSLDELIRSAYPSDVDSPAQYLVTYAYQTHLTLTDQELHTLHEALDQRFTTLSSHFPDFMASLGTALEKGIQSRQIIYADNGGGG